MENPDKQKKPKNRRKKQSRPPVIIEPEKSINFNKPIEEESKEKITENQEEKDNRLTINYQTDSLDFNIDLSVKHKLKFKGVSIKSRN
jgi:hypothetical protein